MNYTTKEISEITNAQLIGNGSLIVSNIAFDSRIIYSTKNTAFIALTSEKNSGDHYISSAIEKGIPIIIAEKKTTDDPNITWIIVHNTLTFLQQLAKYHFENSGLETIGITGSNGKTVIKEWLYQSICNDFSTVKSPKSFNSQLGLPISLLQIDPQHEMGIFEVGISKPGEMQILKSIFTPDIGLLTHIGNAHLANFDSEEQLINEKIKLFADSKTIIYNGDNILTVNKITESFSTKKLISYGFGKNNNIFIKNDYNNRKEDIIVQYFDEEFSFPASKRDEATLSNVLALIAVLKELNFNNGQIIDRINALKSVEMRLESVEGNKNNLIINDSYNLDLDSLRIAFQFIKEYNRSAKSLVLTDFVDITDDKTRFYNTVVELVNEQNFDTVYLIGEEISQHYKQFNSETFSFNNTNELIDSKSLTKIENHLILLKGARKFEIEKVKEHLELRKHDTTLEVNLNSLIHNINVHKSVLKPSTKMMAMVKANAYGLGSYDISEFLQYHHIDYLGVAVADEGAELRKRGITTPIIVMNPERHSYKTIIEYNLEPEIYSLRVLDLFCEELQNSGVVEPFPIHIKLETGMHRLGFRSEDFMDLMDHLQRYNVTIKSIFSHLATADMPEESQYVYEQLETFEVNSNRLINLLGYQPIRHILNSSGILNYPSHQYEMVRIGIGMMGIAYHKEFQKKLKPVVSFNTVISQISEIKKGESVGYARRFVAEKDTKVATIPVGYADGIPRLIGNKKAYLSVNNNLVPIVGNVCMDMLMLDIGENKVNEGDHVVIFNGNPSLEDFSNYCQTIPYEVLTSISPRVKRVYIKD